MSTAPRPQTSPSMSSPAEGVVTPVVAVGGDDVGVTEQGTATAHRGVGPRSGPPGRSGPAGARGSRDRGRGVRGAIRRTSALRCFVARLGGTVVHAGVADHLLQQLRHFPGEVALHGRILWRTTAGSPVRARGRGRTGPDGGRGGQTHLRAPGWLTVRSHVPLPRRRRRLEHRDRRSFHAEPPAARRRHPGVPGRSFPTPR